MRGGWFILIPFMDGILSDLSRPKSIWITVSGLLLNFPVTDRLYSTIATPLQTCPTLNVSQSNCTDSTLGYTEKIRFNDKDDSCWHQIG